VPAIKLDNENIGGHCTPLHLVHSHRPTMKVGDHTTLKSHSGIVCC